MKQSRRLSSISFEEARKIEAIAGFYDPEYFRDNLLSFVREIKFDSLIWDEGYFGELYKLLELYKKTDKRYTDLLVESFVFYQEDLYSHTKNILNKLRKSIKENALQRTLERKGYIKSRLTDIKFIQETKPSMTLNGNYILDIIDEKFSGYKLLDNLEGYSVNVGNHKVFYTERSTVNFDLTMVFGKPTVINTLSVPVSEPLPRYIKSITFSSGESEDTYSLSDLSTFSDGYQLEILMYPIAVTKIKIEFRNAPTERNTEDVDLREKSFIESVFRGSRNNEFKLADEGILSFPRKMNLCFIAYPSLRKYAPETVLRFNVNHFGTLKAAFSYVDVTHFYSKVDTSLKWTNIESRLAILQNNEVSLFDLPNQKSYLDEDQELFIFPKKGEKISFNKGVFVENYLLYLRGNEEVPLGYLSSDNHIEINYKYEEGMVLKYSYDSSKNHKRKARIDFFGNLVFTKNEKIDNAFLTLRLSAFHQFYTPIISNIAIGLTK